MALYVHVLQNGFILRVWPRPRTWRMRALTHVQQPLSLDTCATSQPGRIGAISQCSLFTSALAKAIR